MTRKKEIEQAWFGRMIQSCHRYDEKSFKESAEWADKTMIDKVCEWLRKNIDFYVETKYDEDFRVDIEQLLKDIRKAMEE